MNCWVINGLELLNSFLQAELLYGGTANSLLDLLSVGPMLELIKKYIHPQAR